MSGIFFVSAPPPHPIPRGFRGEHFKVTKHQVFKKYLGMQLSWAITITLQIFRATTGNPREGGANGREGREGEARAKPVNQLVN